jgi:beta-propeller repeat-containing protein
MRRTLAGRGRTLQPLWSLDPSGNIYLVGRTTSTDLPGTANSFQPMHAPAVFGNMDVFIAKFDPTGTELLWASYLGGNGDDSPVSAKVDANGNIYVIGTTFSSNFPITNLVFGSPLNGIQHIEFVCRED